VKYFLLWIEVFPIPILLISVVYVFDSGQKGLVGGYFRPFRQEVRRGLTEKPLLIFVI